MVKQPCEIIVNYVLPSIRAQLSKELIDLGNTQNQVSCMLDITPAAVSQYVSGKRGYTLDFDDDSVIIIRELAEEIDEDDDRDMGKDICKLCRLLWDTHTINQLEERFEGITEGCGGCVSRG
ncbi:MAG: transcriptional regulator [Thermoplasmata archaeon]